jgi:uncharacterized protein (TIGR00159 family)
MLIGIKDIIDILLVSTILFGAYQLLRKSGASNLFWGILAFVLAWVLVSYVFDLELTGALFERFISVGAVVLVIIFQTEIRSFFYGIGARFNMERIRRHWSKTRDIEKAQRQINSIALACSHLSASKTGALIVIANQQGLSEYSDTGEVVDAAISVRIIENIFFKNTPLHDGAMIISAGRIHAAACILPVSKRQDLPKSYGLRHRAALGLTEKTDAIAIVVSEETGKISVAIGNVIRVVTINELEHTYLAPAFGISETTKADKTTDSAPTVQQSNINHNHI